jgi:spoIIIJ-associated protein
VQWVVTTGRTVAEARARALDALGIDEAELEFEVLAEPARALFGLRTTEARVRARVRPTRPRPKVDRRNRRNQRTGRGDDKGRRRARGKDRSGAAAPAAEAPTPAAPEEQAPSRPVASPAADPPRSDHEEPSRTAGTRGAPTMSDIPLDTQEPTAVDFVQGLVRAFGADAEVSARHDEDDDALEINVEGEDLGLLVGPRGTTLSAIAELTRTAVAQQHSGRLEGRLRVDVAGYRARRKEALIRFAGQIADKVRDTGEAVALEPMSPPDRKIVHDAVNDIDGVHTSSRGEDQRRHVVIHPDD